MLNLGIIGTNWITGAFVDAALLTKEYKLHSVYSRTLESAGRFAGKYGESIELFDSLDAFLSDETLDIVYIASPNGLHFTQARETLLHEKHVIVEKPAFSTPKEMEEILKIAAEKNCFYFEAIRSLHEKSFTIVKEIVEKEEVWGAEFCYAKYSSRMEALLRGEEPNIFSPKFSGGALMDLGVYLVYPAIALFGLPQSVRYTARLLPSGVDGYGVGVLRYENFDVQISPGKNIDNYAPSQIYFSNGTLILGEVSTIDTLVYKKRNEIEETIETHPHEHGMFDEANAFAKIIATNDIKKYEELADLSQKVNQVLYDMRMDAGIEFAADKE
ncbi:Predicted dehydrogenase [Pilibacter termitis]|uniref:Predicted dehydrogenase n=1 Tax=Pilibacter termitis TaxID=263852 RepID=A0A1T4NZ11_9ENTE|nr:Gfo/Idh/MocA family oxidoreductase [Pilibacter termitis]SJZ84503.1 Predicted dehydrogenase [Pilibacter termitis]